MDLNDVINKVLAIAPEAHRAFHAGHHGTAEEFLSDISEIIDAYLLKQKKLTADVTESTTSEKQKETQTEQPDAVPGAQVRPAAVVPEKLDPQAEQQPESQKQTR